MKISYYYEVFGPAGGIERASAIIAGLVASQGHSVTYHCAEARSAPLPGVAVRSHRLPGWPHALRIAAFATLARHLARQDDGISHAHQPVGFTDVITAHSCHRAGMDAVSRIATASSAPTRNLGASDAMRLRLERQVYGGQLFHAAIAVSAGVRDELVRAYGVDPHVISVIPNGVEPSRFVRPNRELVRSAFRSRAGIPGNALLLLFVGNEFHRKGLQEAILGLRDCGIDDACLAVAGDDESTPYRHLAASCGIADRVVFLGKVLDIESAFLSADMFVMPTAYEAFSVAMIEAAAAGLPLLLTQVNGVSELLTDGHEGLIIERTRGSVAAAVHRLATDRDLRERMGRAARTRSEEFHWERIAERTIAIYEQVNEQKSLLRAASREVPR